MLRLSMSKQYKARKAVARECRTTYMTERKEHAIYCETCIRS